jgi:Holliday junction resolvasome RuvABC endonuclease subunit
MITWGVDLGVRSLYVARLDDGDLSLYSHHSLKIHRQSRGAELQTLQEWLADTLGDGQVWIEEPPLAGSRNLQTYLHLSQVSGVVGAVSGAQANYAPVSSWKKGTVGNGAAGKELVANWLRARFPRYHDLCGGDQNLIDATCIALWGSVDQSGPGFHARSLRSA